VSNQLSAQDVGGNPRPIAIASVLTPHEFIVSCLWHNTLDKPVTATRSASATLHLHSHGHPYTEFNIRVKLFSGLLIVNPKSALNPNPMTDRGAGWNA
jgi:hypothetical protein